MSTFQTANAARTPFGKNQYLRSTKRKGTLSYTFSKEGIPAQDIDGDLIKVLQPGTVVAKITTGPETGKIGVFQAGGTDEVQTLTGTGTISGGTWDLTILNTTITGLAYNITASALQTAIRAAVAANTSATDAEQAIADGLTVTGGPLPGAGVFTITYDGETGANVAQATVVTTSLTGAGAGISVATTTGGAAGATDGRSSTANIVGIVDTFLPWQLNERDVEVSVVYDAAVVQAWCIEYNAAGAPVALTNTTRDAILARTDLDIIFPGQ